VEIHINDLSFFGQYQDVREFRSNLEPFLRFRLKHPEFSAKLYCSRLLSSRPATKNRNVQQAVLDTRDQNYIGLVLNWLAKSGPFWDDDRFKNLDDYFHFEGSDVTDQGLGEAARRVLGGVQAGSYSFLDPSYRFSRSPLTVNHGLEEAPLGTVKVPNFWTTTSLESILAEDPVNWEQLVAISQGRFTNLMFSVDISFELRKTPFDYGIACRVLDLLAVLQELVRETNTDGSFTNAGLELWQKHSVGDKAWFTDESDNNKRYFKKDLTFRDPVDAENNIFCPWHGKVKKGQFRIHFEWPRPKDQRGIKVVYIGPKITKA
jgi:hypothetical protein